MLASWFLFFLSVGSKSASLTLPLVLVFLHYRFFKFKRIYLVIPYFMISLWGTYNILKSPVTQEGSNRANIVAKISEGESREIETKDEIKPIVKPKKKKYSKAQIALAAEYAIKLPDESKTEEPKEEKKQEEKVNKILNFDLKKISQILHYYFWQALIPINNEPVKGINLDKAGWNEVLHVFFLLCLIIIFFKDSAIFYLLSAHVMILPFIGIIPAPYMSLTWVSDQHLYLALPGILAFWMRIVDKINFKYIYILPISFLVLYSFKTLEATSFYKNQFTFYEKCLDYNPTNVPIAYNLAYARAINGDLRSSQQVLNQSIDLSQSVPMMKKSIYYPHLVNLYFMVNRYGEVLGELLKKNGHTINGTTRTESKLTWLENKELNPSLLSYPEHPLIKLDSDVIILNIPPFPEQLEWFKSWNWSKDSKLIFISSTSVYPSPHNASAEILQEEEHWIKANFPRYAILRLGGLFSDSFHPGKYLSGKENLPGRLWPVNLVHLKDAAGFTKIVIDQKLESKTFHVVCNEHPSREEYYTNYCLKSSLPIPKFDPNDFSTKLPVPSEEASRLYTFTPL
jgi:hypothetical protein